MSQAKFAVMTFTYEGDQGIVFDMLESLTKSFKQDRFDLFITDDASPSQVGQKVIEWGRARGIKVTCHREEQNQGFRGAVERTLRLLQLIADAPVQYDVILRIDTDALVIREGLDVALRNACDDPRALYGVIKYMRPRDRLGLLSDLLPIGLKRRSNGAKIEREYRPNRMHPVWWWSIGLNAFLRGFDFGFVEGSCYAMGGRLPAELAKRGMLKRYSRGRHGLITSEEDIVVTMMCRAAGLPFRHLDKHDKSWRDVNVLGERVLTKELHELPYVVHALKPDAKGAALRAKIKARMPLFS